MGVKHTPELKNGNPTRVNSIFGSQEKYAQKMIDEFKDAGIDPKKVFAQSFNKADIFYWLQNEPNFGKQAVYLDDIDPTDAAFPPLTDAELHELKTKGVKIIAPPITALLKVNASGEIVPSDYAVKIKGMGFDIITWSFERADLRRGAKGNDFYYFFDTTNGVTIKKDSDMYKALDVLAKQVKVRGIFSDWPGTVSYYASCMNMK